MSNLAVIVAACGALVGTVDGRFRHFASAWQVAPGEWVTAWTNNTPPPTDLRLLLAASGDVAEIAAWECDDGVAGFTATAAGDILPVATEATLHKHDRLVAVGFPSVIDHPAFSLHRGSLDPQRYFPYLCPWRIDAALALFTGGEGYLAAASYHGMAGGPVLDQAGRVVGVLTESLTSAAPPLARFRRFG